MKTLTQQDINTKNKESYLSYDDTIVNDFLYGTLGYIKNKNNTRQINNDVRKLVHDMFYSSLGSDMIHLHIMLNLKDMWYVYTKLNDE